MSNIKLIDITKINSNVIRENVYELLSQLSNTIGYSTKQQFETLLIYLRTTQTHKIWCVYYDDEMIGILTTLLEPKIIHGFGYVLHVEDFIIHQKWRGCGFGKKVMDKIREYANSVHAYKIILNCSEENIGFYEKCGFSQKNVEMSLYL